jgi:hypothetical protein
MQSSIDLSPPSMLLDTKDMALWVLERKIGVVVPLLK